MSDVPAKKKKSPRQSAVNAAPDCPDRVRHLPGYGPVDEVQFAGYASVRGATGNNGADAADEKLFYWFVGAPDHEKKPTILWTNGGPGSSSFWGFFLENGPYEISADGKTLSRRPQAWNDFANYLIFEHPLSVTLSVAEKAADIPANVEVGIDQLYQAFLNFLEMHPELAKTPLILAGESYAGTYLPLLAKAILDGNRRGLAKIDLRVMVLCDAWVDPMVQMAQDTRWALTHGLISEAQKRMLDEAYKDRLPEINNAIQQLCGVYMTNTAQLADPSFKPIYEYLNDPAVRAALHVPAHYPKLTKNWSPQIGNNYQARVNESFRPVVQELLDGGPDAGQDAKRKLVRLDGSRLHMRVVSGLNDAKDCNFLGTQAWLDLLQGDAAYRFQAAPTHPWKDAQKNVIGFQQNGGQLGWLKVLNAGHMAARDQPALIQYLMDSLKA